MNTKKTKLNISSIIITLVLLAIIYRPLITLFIPGILILLNKNIRSKCLMKCLLYIIGASLGYWTITPWFIRFIKMGLIEFIYLSIIFTLIIVVGYFIIILKKGDNKKVTLNVNKSSWIILLIFLLVLFIRFIPYYTLLAPPSTGDITMHATISRLIVENNALPTNYKPLMPIESFGAYAAGYQTIAAIMSLVSGLAIYRSIFLLACLTYVLITFALYIYLRKYFRNSTAIIVSLIGTFLTTYPQLFFHWGGNSTAFSFFYIIIGLTLLDKIEERKKKTNLLITSAILSSSALTHMSIFVSFFYLYIFILAYKFITTYKQKRYINILRNCLLIGIISLIFLAPYLIELNSGLSIVDKKALENTVYDHTISIIPEISLLSYILIGPIQMVGYISFIISLIAFFGLLILIRKKEYKTIKENLIMLFGIIILLINSYHLLLPYSYVLISDRLSVFFILPLSVFAGFTVKTIIKKYKRYLIMAAIIYFIISAFYLNLFDPFDFEHSPYNTERVSIGIDTGIQLIIFQSLLGPAALYMFGMSPDSVLTQADLKAFDWIKENTEESSIFLNNFNDAGRWILSATYRPILFPHGSVLYGKEINDAYKLHEFTTPDTDPTTIARSILNTEPFKNSKVLRERNVQYIYIGKKSLGKQKFIAADFISEDFKEVYNKEGVTIFKIID